MTCRSFRVALEPLYGRYWRAIGLTGEVLSPFTRPARARAAVDRVPAGGDVAQCRRRATQQPRMDIRVLVVPAPPRA